MAPPLWTAGQILAAADVNAWFVPTVAYKTANQSVTSSTTLVNDSELSVSVTASAIYLIAAVIHFDSAGPGSGNLKWGWTGPAGLTMPYVWAGGTTAGATGQVLGDTPNAAGAGTGVPAGVIIQGTVKVSSTAGTLQFQFAQNTLSAIATIVHAGSAIVLQRLT